MLTLFLFLTLSDIQVLLQGVIFFFIHYDSFIHPFTIFHLKERMWTLSLQFCRLMKVETLVLRLSVTGIQITGNVANIVIAFIGKVGLVFISLGIKLNQTWELSVLSWRTDNSHVWFGFY